MTDANSKSAARHQKTHTLLFLTLQKQVLFTMGVMSMRLYCFWQPSGLQPSARSLEELQMESITIYFDAWESLDIDLGWWQFPGKCWGNQSGWCVAAICKSMPSAIKRMRISQGCNSFYLFSPDSQQAECTWTWQFCFVKTCFSLILLWYVSCVAQTTENYELGVYRWMATDFKGRCLKNTNGRRVTAAWRGKHVSSLSFMHVCTCVRLVEI